MLIAARVPVSVSAVDPSPNSVTPPVAVVRSRPAESLTTTERPTPGWPPATLTPDRVWVVPAARVTFAGAVTTGSVGAGVVTTGGVTTAPAATTVEATDFRLCRPCGSVAETQMFSLPTVVP